MCSAGKLPASARNTWRYGGLGLRQPAGAMGRDALFE